MLAPHNLKEGVNLTSIKTRDFHLNGGVKVEIEDSKEEELPSFDNQKAEKEPLDVEIKSSGNKGLPLITSLDKFVNQPFNSSINDTGSLAAQS